LSLPALALGAASRWTPPPSLSASPVAVKPASKKIKPTFVFVAAGAGAAREAAAARIARLQASSPWAPLAKPPVLWSTPVPGQPLRAAALSAVPRLVSWN
jgi:hypothetical protein